MVPQGIYHAAFYSETAYLFIYSLGMLILLEHTNHQNKKLMEMNPLKYALFVLMFAANGFIRSVGFLSAAHVCYPILLDLIKTALQRKSIIKHFFTILITSIIFLAPFSLKINKVYNQYCVSEVLKVNTPTCLNTQQRWFYSPNTCPMMAQLDYGRSELPSFCQKMIPNYYPWI